VPQEGAFVHHGGAGGAEASCTSFKHGLEQHTRSIPVSIPVTKASGQTNTAAKRGQGRRTRNRVALVGWG